MAVLVSAVATSGPQDSQPMISVPASSSDCVAVAACPANANPTTNCSRLHSQSQQKQKASPKLLSLQQTSHPPAHLEAPRSLSRSSSQASSHNNHLLNNISSSPWIRPISLTANTAGAHEFPARIPRSRLFYTTSDQGSSSGLGTVLRSLDLPLAHSHSFSHSYLSSHSRSHSHDSVFDENDHSRAVVMAPYALYSGQAPAIAMMRRLQDYESGDDECDDDDTNSDSYSLDDGGLCERYRQRLDANAPAAPNASTIALRSTRSYSSSISCCSGCNSLADSSHSHSHHHSSSHSTETAPFHKWMRTLQRRAEKRPQPIGFNAPWKLLDQSDGATLSPPLVHHSRRLSTASDVSSDFVGAAKTASISVASTCFARSQSHSRTFNRSRSTGSRTDRSSKASHVGNRLSIFEDDLQFPSSPTAVLPPDPAAMDRAIHRRRLLEELIKTEEGYIGDVRFLMNVYITILAGLPTLPEGLRASINHNLTAIVELHEEILEELYRAVPGAEYGSLESEVASASTQKSSIDYSGPFDPKWNTAATSVPKIGSLPWVHDSATLFAEAQITEDVAKIFTKKMSRFFIYKEYGAKYEMMIKDVTAAHRTMPDWDSYQKGLETLALSLGPTNNKDNASRKALTISDLLVKPIQRACRYPLIFSELLKYTPSEDCPNSHMAVEEALIRLREATAEINRATTDVRIKTTLERTWMLQDRLVFANHRLDAVSKNRIRSFGHIKLCGTLHACWQTKDSAEGQYMICLLYNSVMCLASASKADQIYTIQACIPLYSLRVEEADNGRGIQCHTAPFSWKLVFEHDHQLYELMLTACSPKEELEWKSRFTNREISIDTEKQDISATRLGFLSLPIKSLGAVFGKPGTATHRISIQRASTIGPKNQMCQVLLKNTCVLREAKSPTKSTVKSPSGTTINRSQSLIASNNNGYRIAVLSPPRAERARLESMLSDIWSKDILPFPGMTARARSEHMVRATTSSMIRRLSVVSITSSFSRRTSSHASVSRLGSNTRPTSGPGSMRPGTPPMPFDEPVTMIHNMTRRSTDITPTCPMFEDIERPMRPLSQLPSQLPTIEDEIDRKPLRRMTLPVSPPRFTMRDFWTAGEDGLDELDILSNKTCSPTDTGLDEDVLVMRAGKNLAFSRPCSCNNSLSSADEDKKFVSMRSAPPQPIQVHETSLSPILSPILSPRRAFEDMDIFDDRLKMSEEYGRRQSSTFAILEDGSANGASETGIEEGEDGSPRKNTMTRRMSKRWSASSGRHRDSMVSGIRSLFR